MITYEDTELLTAKAFWATIPCWEAIGYELKERGLTRRLKNFLPKSDKYVEIHKYSMSTWKKALKKYKEKYEDDHNYSDFWFEQNPRTLNSWSTWAVPVIGLELAKPHPQIYIQMYDKEAVEDKLKESDSSCSLFWADLEYTNIYYHPKVGSSNIVWDVYNLVDVDSIKIAYMKKFGKDDLSHFCDTVMKYLPYVLYRPTRSFDLFFQPYLPIEYTEELCEELGLEKVKPNRTCKCHDCLVCPLQSPQDIKICSNKKMTSKEEIRTFLDVQARIHPYQGYSSKSIKHELYNDSYGCDIKVSSALRSLLLEKKIKIVNFGINGRPYPIYQSIKGSQLEMNIIDEKSEEYLKSNLISISAYCKEHGIDPSNTSIMFKEAENLKVNGVYTRKTQQGTGGSLGYFYKFEKAELDRIIISLRDKGELKEKAQPQVNTLTPKEKILNFLNKNTLGTNSFTRGELSRALSLSYGSDQVALKSLLSEKKIKIVAFTQNGHVTPCYQIVSGKCPEIPIIKKGSDEYKRLNIITTFSFQQNYWMNGLNPTQLLKIARENGLTPTYVLSSNGYSENYKIEDLKEIVKQHKTSLTTNVIKGEEILEGTQEPILLPDTQAQECFKPKNLFKKVFDFFGYKLNFNVTVEKKKTVANTGQDLIEF